MYDAPKDPRHFDAERGFEVGGDEFWKSALGNLYNNMKRTYDVYQNEQVEASKAMHLQLMKVLSDAQADTEAKRKLADQAVQNAIETANMVSKRALSVFDRQDLVFDKQLNKEPAEAAAENQILSPVAIEAIKAAIIGAVTEALRKK